MLNLVELGSYHLPLIHLCLKCVLPYFQEKLVGFDRKEDFRSSFKEDGKSNEAPKKCREQGEAAHCRALGRAAVAGATHGRPCVIARPCRPPATRDSAFLRLFNCFHLGFLGPLSTSFSRVLGEN